MTLEIAEKMYKGSDESLRSLALQNFPELGMKITDRVKTFEDACKMVGVDSGSDFFTNSYLRPHELAQRKIETIIRALNEEWEANWDDSSQYKYRPWFKRSSSGSGFSYLGYDFALAFSLVGSRLVFKSSELCVYAAKQFTEIYKEMFTL